MVRSRKRDSDDSEMEDATETQKRVEEPEPEEEEEADGEEAEYEIEAVLDAKYGHFGDGKAAYLVKWRGYGEEDNSWVNEDDASNAQDLINAYWKEHGGRTGKKGPRKSEPKGKSSAVQKRKSPVVVDEDEDSDPPEPPKKRGKQAKSASDDEDHEKVASTTKAKQKTSTGASAKKPRASENNGTAYVNMKQWKNAASWNHLVHHIETVERTKDGQLLVYFTLKDKSGKEGGLCCEPTSICKEKMPMLLLEFYENNLRWRETDS